jgi:hypothetical protein
MPPKKKAAKTENRKTPEKPSDVLNQHQSEINAEFHAIFVEIIEQDAPPTQV